MTEGLLGYTNRPMNLGRAGNVRNDSPTRVVPRVGFESSAGVEPKSLPGSEAPPAEPPSEAFCHHFFRCFFCHIGDRYIEDHFCEQGRELLVEMLDEIAEREGRL